MIVDSVLPNNGEAINIFFAFLTNTIIKSLEVSYRKSFLIKHGMTAHKMISIPVKRKHAAVAPMPFVCPPSKLQNNIIRNCDVIFWNEITMTAALTAEGVDMLLCSI